MIVQSINAKLFSYKHQIHLFFVSCFMLPDSNMHATFCHTNAYVCNESEDHMSLNFLKISVTPNPVCLVQDCLNYFQHRQRLDWKFKCLYPQQLATCKKNLLFINQTDQLINQLWYFTIDMSYLNGLTNWWSIIVDHQSITKYHST